MMSLLEAISTTARTLLQINPSIKSNMALSEIEKLTSDFAEERALLCSIVEDMQAEQEKLKRKYLPILRNAVANAARAKLSLHNLIFASPKAFEKPRTQIFSGIKVGFQKGKGGIEFDDEDKTVALIEKQFGKQAIAYLRITKSPDKKMLADLSVTELKKLGCTVADTGDVVVIKPTDGEIEKTVAALLKDAVETEI
jgi:hypothetical protein